MTISIDEVRHIAALARLELTPEEERLFAEQLSTILDHVETLRSVDTEGVPPTVHAAADRPRLRDDVTRPTGDVEVVLGNAPDRSGNFFRVPKILD